MRPEDRERIAGLIDLSRQIRSGNEGRFPPGFARRQAAMAGMPLSTFYQYVRDGLPSASEGGWRWGPDEKAVLVLCAGDVTAVRDWLAEDAGSDEGLPSVRWMQVTKFRDLAPDEIALAEKGERAARAKRMVLQIEAGRRNELWLADYKALDVQLLVPRTTRPRRPWAVLIVDAYSRKLVGWSIALTRHSQAEVLAALQAAIADHGTPETLMFDKGLEFTADAVRDAARDLVFAAVSTREYRPHHKGKIERLAQTLGHRVVRHLAHRTDLPVTMSGEPIVQIRDDEGNPVPGLFADAFIERFAIEATLYNRRVHSALAATPESVYREDGWPERLVSPEHLERFMLKGGIRTVREGGIRFANKWYFAEQLDGHRGVKVEIRYRQDIPDKLHVYRDGRKWCVATVHNRAGASAREAVLASRRKRVNEAGRIKRRARKLAERRFRVITADHRAPEETTVITRADVAAELPGPSARQRRAMAALRSGSDTSERVTGPGKDAQ